MSFFGGVFAVNTLLFLALQAYIARNLIKPELAPLQDPHAMRKAMVGPASYLVGAAAAWVSVHAAFVIYALTPLFYITPPNSMDPPRRRRRGTPRRFKLTLDRGRPGGGGRMVNACPRRRGVLGVTLAVLGMLRELQPRLRQGQPERLVLRVLHLTRHAQAVFRVAR